MPYQKKQGYLSNQFSLEPAPLYYLVYPASSAADVSKIIVPTGAIENYLSNQRIETFSFSVANAAVVNEKTSTNDKTIHTKKIQLYVLFNPIDFKRKDWYTLNR